MAFDWDGWNIGFPACAPSGHSCPLGKRRPGSRYLLNAIGLVSAEFNSAGRTGPRPMFRLSQRAAQSLRELGVGVHFIPKLQWQNC